MRGRRRFGALVLSCSLAACLAASGQPAAPPAKLDSRWEPGVYHLGNLVPLVVEVPVPSQAFYVQGDLHAGFEWGDGRVARVRQTLPRSFPGTVTLVADLQVFAVGTVTVPPLALSIRTEDATRAYVLTPPPLAIAPLLPPGEQPQPPAAGPLPVPAPFPWAPTVGGVLFLALASWLVWRWLRRRALSRGTPKPVPDLKTTDPDRWVRQGVERILSGSSSPAERYAALSALLREYLEIKFGQPFLEWTTTEIHRAVRDMPALGGQPTSDLLGILALCDWIVFARYAPEPAEERETAERVTRLLRALSAPPEMEKAS